MPFGMALIFALTIATSCASPSFISPTAESLAATTTVLTPTFALSRMVTPPSSTPTPQTLPSATASATMSATPTIDLASLIDVWAIHTDQERGFSFEYPALYNYAPYQADCGIRTVTDGIAVGALNYLLIFSDVNTDFHSFVDRTINEKKTQNGWVIESRRETEINQQSSITIEYRTDANGGRYGTVTFFYDNKRASVYAFNIVGFSIDCDIPGSKLNEYSLHDHMIQTFKMAP